ncbi:MAG: dihydrolipoyllysine-residue acetyltransferase [Arenicellales bacterium]|nr:dihydrolipoyllysine-residue acetyltransferase [Arenicellales bacterium]
MLSYKEIEVPDIGHFRSVPVIEVLVEEGEKVEVNSPLITVQSEQGAMDVPSPLTGKVQEVIVQVGDRVTKGSSILLLETEVEDPNEADSITIEDREPVLDAEPTLNIEPTLDAERAVEPVIMQPNLEDEAKAYPAATVAEGAETEEYTPEPSMGDDALDIITISVPDIGDFEEVDVIEVHIAEGDQIKMEDPLITLESDKATMDVPSPMTGTIVDVLTRVGDKISEGDAIANLRLEAGDSPAILERRSEPPVELIPEETELAVTVEQEAPAESENLSPIPPQPEPTPVASIKPEAVSPNKQEANEFNVTDITPRPPTLPESPQTTQETLPHASPGVRKFARELGVDLTRVNGSGPKGRILKEDVQQWVKKALTEPAPVDTKEQVAPGAGIPEMPDIDFAQFGEIETRPLSRIKKLTATNLSRAWLNVPHVTQHDEADITELEEFRQDLKKEQETKGGARITMLSFVMKACVVALKQFPNFNASIAKGGENLILKRYYHLGIAVDTEDGLVVPVVRDVDRKTIRDLAGELNDISKRAREKKLSPKDLQGASFTISSLGGIGGTAFTPIVNAPEVAILGVSRSSMKPVYSNGEFVPRLILPLSLSYDHRVIDGAEAARFTSFLAKVLADVRHLLL